MPASDQGRHRTWRSSRRARAGDEPRQRTIQPLTPPLEHDPEKWRPVFRKRSCSNKKVQRNAIMAELTLDVARKILDVALAKAVEKKLKPLVITVLDARGCVKITAAQDGTSLLRSEIAHGKAYGALAMGMGSRALFQRESGRAHV